jgi:hypothetical protein
MDDMAVQILVKGKDSSSGYPRVISNWATSPARIAVFLWAKGILFAIRLTTGDVDVACPQHLLGQSPVPGRAQPTSIQMGERHNDCSPRWGGAVGLFACSEQPGRT